MPFCLQSFIEQCKLGLLESDSQAAIRESIKEAISSPADVVSALGTPKLAGLETLYHAEDLTILNIIWAPHMTLHPHNHCMWANIGIYGGVEENNFFQRSTEGLIQNGQATLRQGDVSPLHQDVIHEVHNPSDKLTAAIHVYGGDFFNAPRSEWDPETLTEQPFDIEHTRAVFAEANKLIDQS